MGSPAATTARVAHRAWIARHAARLASAAARSAAAPRPRSAAAARSLTATASHLARSASAAACRAAHYASFVAGLFDGYDDRPRRRSSSLPAPARDPVRGVDVTAKDLESDEAVWALYEQWCKAFNKERSRDEMAHRFSTFNHAAEFVHTLNTTDPDWPVCLGERCDGLDDAQQIANSSAQERAGTYSGFSTGSGSTTHQQTNPHEI